MPFDQQAVRQLEDILDKRFAQQEVRLRAVLQEELIPLRQELAVIREELGGIKARLDRLFRTETEDIHMAYREIASLKKRINKLERDLAALK